jgi:hypothetical protein
MAIDILVLQHAQYNIGFNIIIKRTKRNKCHGSRAAIFPPKMDAAR